MGGGGGVKSRGGGQIKGGGGAQKVSPPLRGGGGHESCEGGQGGGVMKVLRVVRGGGGNKSLTLPAGSNFFWRVAHCYIIRRQNILSQRCWDGDRPMQKPKHARTLT